MGNCSSSGFMEVSCFRFFVSVPVTDHAPLAMGVSLSHFASASFTFTLKHSRLALSGWQLVTESQQVGRGRAPDVIREPWVFGWEELIQEAAFDVRG